VRRRARAWVTPRCAGMALLLLAGGVITAVGAPEAEAQSRGQARGDRVGSIAAGGTLYAADTRFDDGIIVRGSVGYALTPAWMLEAGVGRHACFDCDRFWILDAGVQWQRPGERFRPYVSIGGGRASDPGFVGVEWGPYASAGSRIALDGLWGVQAELRVRQLGLAVRGADGMGELTVGVTRAIGR
jgi:hypothetical protein